MMAYPPGKQPTEVDFMNRLRVQAENKAALYRRALELACNGDGDEVARFVSEASTAIDEERAADGVQEDDEAIAPERLRMADALDEIAKPLAQGSASIVRRAAEMLRRTHVVLGIDSTGWVRLADSDWVNIVNAPSVLDPLKDKEEAVREAVKLTEARLKALNVGPWCCPNGRAQGLEVCRDCAEANAGYLAAMGPHGVTVAPDQTFLRQTPMDSGEGQSNTK